MLRETPRLLRQLNQLDQVLDSLEPMNLHEPTDVPTTVTDMLHASGLSETRGLQPTILIPRVLDGQRLPRRELALLRGTGAT